MLEPDGQFNRAALARKFNLAKNAPATLSTGQPFPVDPKIQLSKFQEEKSMKRMFAVFCVIVALSLPALAQGDDKMKSEKKSGKKAEASAPKSDADIQKCIADKLAKSEKLSTQGFSAAVSNGDATLTGNANNAGSKGAATKIAKSCGASKVTNNITSPPVSKKKSDDAKPADKKG